MTRAAWVLLAALAVASPCSAQPPPLPDSTAAPPPSPKITSTFTRTGEEQDRFEIGGGLVKGYFDANGTFAYRRLLHQGQILERSIMGEVTGTTKSPLTEGAFGTYLLFRPVKSYRETWKLRPLIEGGPAAHIVVQGASLEGLSRTSYKAHVYLKSHVYAGFEAILSRKFGLVVRGRLSTPSHRPLDYAQAAILLR